MTTFDPLRIGVVGLGPVGSILAVHLQAAGVEVVGCDIDQEKVKAIGREGIQLTGAITSGDSLFSVTHSVSDLMEQEPAGVAIAVKAPYLRSVIQSLQPFPGSYFVISVQNGIDNEQELAKAFVADRTMRMVVNYAGNGLTHTEIQVTFFNPPNYLAGLGPAGRKMADEISRRLTQVNLETVVPENLQYHVWEKAILNASLSPVCAVTGTTMKTVMESPEGRALVKGIILEGVGVAAAEEIHFPPDFVETCLGYLEKGGDHRPSMLVDLDNRRSTEIDVLNGKLVEYGRRHGIATPLNHTIAVLVKLLETRILREKGH